MLLTFEPHSDTDVVTKRQIWHDRRYVRSVVFCWPSLGHIVICWMSILLQIEDLKNDNALLRAQLQQHGLEISETTSQWQKKKKTFSRINSLKWRIITPQWLTCSRLITDLRCSATQVGYECLFDTQTHFLLTKDSLAVVKIRSAVKAHFVFSFTPVRTQQPGLIHTE